MLSISTAWSHKDHADGRQILAQIKETGIPVIELGYRLTHIQLEQIISLLNEFKLQVSSLHNFVPLPNDFPSLRHPSNYYRLSALDEDERRRAVVWTKNTIDVAVRVKAKVVVVHAGMIELPKELPERLIHLYKTGKAPTQEFQAVRMELITARQKARGPFIESVVKSFQEIMPYAQGKNILIGLETRYYPVEIPNCDEIGEFLSQFHKQGMYYWHDVGHAEVNGRLGIAAPTKYLDQYRDQLIGFHLHGVQGLRDHLAPFTGDFDLTKVFPYIKDHHIKVIESSSSATLDQIRSAVKLLP